MHIRKQFIPPLFFDFMSLYMHSDLRKDLFFTGRHWGKQQGPESIIGWGLTRMSSQSSLSDLVTMREGSLTKLLLELCTTQVCRCLYLKALVLVFIFCKSFCRISELKAICWFILFKGHFLVSVLYWPFHCIYDLKDFALQFNCRRLFMELFLLPSYAFKGICVYDSNC